MVRYQLSIDEPERHRVHVRADFPARRGPYELHMPAWSPGSYLIRDYARHVSGMVARDHRGRRLTATKVGKSSWRIEGQSGGLRVDYDVYAFERSVRTSHVTSDHAFLHGPTLFLYTNENRRDPCSLKVTPPSGWKIHCALPTRAGSFRAADYDELVDSPVECGRTQELKLTVDGVPFDTALCGPSRLDATRLRRDFPRIARAQRAIFGPFPFSRYLTIVNFTPASRGGLEHRSSMAIEWPSRRFHDDEQYGDFLALLSHELVHAWNVKHATPAPFRPYDYQRETPTRQLWWFEGVTDYFGLLALRRAGLITAADYLRRLAVLWMGLLATPGRRQMSVAEASYNAWIVLYRPSENSPNVAASYYVKGHILGAMLDLEIRKLTSDRKSLDDVARLIVKRGRHGLPEEGLRAAIEEVAKADLGVWFARNIDGTHELAFERTLRDAGLTLTSPEPTRGAWLGAELETRAGQLRVKSLLAGGPADAAGLSAEDEVVALDGERMTDKLLSERLEELSPGTRVRLTLFREEHLTERTATLGAPPAKLRIVRANRATDTARARCASWLGAAWDELP